MHPFEEQDRDQGCPDLDAQRVFAGAYETLHLKVLLQSLKEQLSGKGLARC